jgi:rod shape determining protein RodA
MTVGLLPITGVPLPFISYGGSSMITNMIAIGLLLNISSQRQKSIFN